MTTLTFSVVGTPGPQGSKNTYLSKNTGRINVVESSMKVKPWRKAVKTAALIAKVHAEKPFEVMLGPVVVDVRFFLARPKHHFRTGKNAHLLRDGAPEYPITFPDTDKLLRSTCDALTEAGVWRDDSQVVSVVASKQYAVTTPPGAEITVEPLTPGVNA